PRFDEVAAGYHGALYLEVSPQSFPVRVQAGHSLNQIRLASGASLLSDAELVELYRTGPLLYDDDDHPVPIERATFNEGLCMGIDLSGRKTGGIIGFRAHPNPPPAAFSPVDSYHPRDFSEPL